MFEEAWEVGATCALAVGVFLLARGTMRESLGGGLHSVQRTSYGELLFAVSVALLFWLKDGHFIAVAQDKPPDWAGALHPADPDPDAVRCGERGRRLAVWQAGVPDRGGDRRASRASSSSSVTAWLISLIAFLLLTDIGRGEAILLAFITAAFGALLEAASWRGLDNLFIPLGLYFLLANLLHLGVSGLALIAGAVLRRADRAAAS